jgi:hypothetical protein
MIGFHEIPVFM